MQHMQCRVLVLVAKSGNGVQQQRALRQPRRVVWPRAAYPPLLTRCLQFHNMVVGCSWYHNHTSAAGGDDSLVLSMSMRDAEGSVLC